jgi:hypothetical protein
MLRCIECAENGTSQEPGGGGGILNFRGTAGSCYAVQCDNFGEKVGCYLVLTSCHSESERELLRGSSAVPQCVCVPHMACGYEFERWQMALVLCLTTRVLSPPPPPFIYAPPSPQTVLPQAVGRVIVVAFGANFTLFTSVVLWLFPALPPLLVPLSHSVLPNKCAVCSTPPPRLQCAHTSPQTVLPQAVGWVIVVAFGAVFTLFTSVALWLSRKWCKSIGLNRAYQAPPRPLPPPLLFAPTDSAAPGCWLGDCGGLWRHFHLVHFSGAVAGFKVYRLFWLLRSLQHCWACREGWTDRLRHRQ